MTDWFEEWFGEDYLRLYPHRDDEDARQAVELVSKLINLQGARVLDLACGQGRHSVHLAALGARVTGLDLSSALLARARERLGASARLVRGDMRDLPFRDRSFDVVVNLFTSFGYFAEERDDLRVLAEAARVLEPGGKLILDYFNAEVIKAQLVAREEKTVAGSRVQIARHISEDGRFVVKEMTPETGRSYTERVRLLAPADLEWLLTDARLRVRQRLGAYDGRTLGPDTPRAIFVAERS